MKSKAPYSGERLYRILLNLYPKRFREAYKSEMLLAFRDLQSNRQTSPLLLWGHLLIDTFTSLSKEHLRNIASPNPQSQVMKLQSSLKVFTLILGMALSTSLIYIALQPIQTSARAVFTVRPNKQANEPTTSILNTLLNNETLLEVANRLDLQDRWQAGNEIPPTHQEITKRLRESITISPIRMTDMVSFEAISIEPELAQKIIGELLTVAEERNNSEPPQWSVISSNLIGGIPGPNTSTILRIGSIAGILIGGLAILGLKRYTIQVSCHRRTNIS